MKEGIKGSFKREKVLGSCLDNLLRRVKVLNLLEIHLGRVQNLLVRPRQFDLHNLLDLAHPHQVLLLEDELHQKDALVVVKFIQDLVVLLKYVSSVGRQVMLKGFAQCRIQLLQRGKLWFNLFSCELR